jgi:hypothetical protein
MCSALDSKGQFKPTFESSVDRENILRLAASPALRRFLRSPAGVKELLRQPKPMVAVAHRL